MATNRYIIKNSHTKIIQRKGVLGYGHDVGGVCFGVVAAGISGILTRRVKDFDSRVREICETSLEKIVDEVAAAQQKFKNGDQLNDHELAMLSAHPLFYSIHLSLYAERGRELFPDAKYIKSQDILLTSSLILPTMLEDEGGLTVADNFSGAYTLTEIIELFKALRETLLANDTKHPIAFKLQSINHATVVGFDPDCDKWILIDANVLPSQLCTAEELSDFLHQLGNFCVYSMQTIVTKKNEISTKRAMQEFKNTERYKHCHTITAERIKRVNGYHATWLHIAACEGDDHMVRILLDQYLKLYVDTNPLTSDDNPHTPIWRACQEGYTKVVELLLQYGAHPDGMVAGVKADNTTPLGIASHNHPDIVKLLMEFGADPNIVVGNNGETILAVAADKGDIEIVKQLLKYKADVNQGVLDSARRGGNEEMIRLIEGHILSLSCNGNYEKDRFFAAPVNVNGDARDEEYEVGMCVIT